MSSLYQQAPMVIESGKGLHIKPRTMNVRENGLNLTWEKMVDFESFSENDYSLREYFKVEGCIPYLEMLNGLTYPRCVKNLWVRA